MAQARAMRRRRSSISRGWSWLASNTVQSTHGSTPWDVRVTAERRMSASPFVGVGTARGCSPLKTFAERHGGAMTRKPNTVPTFVDETAERRCRERQDSAERLDRLHAQQVGMLKLRPISIAISLRLPTPLLERFIVSARAH